MSDTSCMIKNLSLITQLYRYSLVGIVTNVVGYLVYLLLTYLGTTPKLTMTFLYILGATAGFIGNRNLTFAYKGSLLGSGIRYAIAHFFGYLINFLILFIFVDNFGYAHQLVQAVSIIVVAIFLFTTFKYFVFSNQNT